MKKYLLIIAAIIFLGTAAHAATVCFPFQGCTGTSTAPTAGKVLIGNSSGTYTPSFLTAGSNITITTSSGAITIAASGGSGGTTTTINGVSGPTFTFNTSGTNGLSYSTSTGIITLTQATSSASQAGFLSAADWTTFNGKQAAGNYLTGLTGDGIASGPGSAAFTLSTVNSNIGTFGSSTEIPIITVNGKGLITGISTTTFSAGTGSASGTIGLVQFSDGAGGFDADPQFSWNATDTLLTVGNSVSGVGLYRFGIYQGGSDYQEPGLTLADDITLNYGATAGATDDGAGINITAQNGGATSGAGGTTHHRAGASVNQTGSQIVISGGEVEGDFGENPGSLSLIGGFGQTTDSPGGDVAVIPGPRGDGIGTAGKFKLYDPTSFFNASFDTSLFTEDRTFTLSDKTGTFALGTGSTSSLAYWTTANTLAATSTPTLTELGYLSGVSSALQTQLNGKQATITGGATTITTADLTASRALISNSSGKVAVSTTTAAEIGFVNGVTSAIQTQLNGKESSITSGTTAQYWRGDKSFQTLNQAAVAGLTTADAVTHLGISVTNATSSGTLSIPQNKTLSLSGQVSLNTSSAATSASTIKFHDGTAERVLNPEKCFSPSWVIENPTTSEDIPIMVFNATSTITKVRAVNKTAGDTVTFNLGYDSSRATATGSLKKTFTSNQAVTATTTISSLTVNGSSTPATGDILRFFTSAASSTQFTLDVCYRENA